MSEKMPELLPCPFCGGEAKYIHYGKCSFGVFCICGAQTKKSNNHRNAAIAWNTRSRATPAPVENEGADRAACFENTRAMKLLRKGKPFIVIAEDEPYYIGTYMKIRSEEMLKGTWSDACEAEFKKSWEKITRQHVDKWAEIKYPKRKNKRALQQPASADLEAVRKLAQTIADRPNLPNPDRDADWKNCQQWSQRDAREILAILNRCGGGR